MRKQTLNNITVLSALAGTIFLICGICVHTQGFNPKVHYDQRQALCQMRGNRS